MCALGSWGGGEEGGRDGERRTGVGGGDRDGCGVCNSGIQNGPVVVQ